MKFNKKVSLNVSIDPEIIPLMDEDSNKSKLVNNFLRAYVGLPYSGDFEKIIFQHNKSAEEVAKARWEGIHQYDTERIVKDKIFVGYYIGRGSLRKKILINSIGETIAEENCPEDVDPEVYLKEVLDPK